MYQAVYAKELTEKEKSFVEFEYTKYEASKDAACCYTPFHFIAKDGDAIVGVISGYTCWQEVYIDDLVVREENRGSGIGRMLLEAAEQHFSGKGFHNINLVTSAFQAPGFYQKCGFELEFVRRNENNPKLDKYFFVKFFQQ